MRSFVLILIIACENIFCIIAQEQNTDLGFGVYSSNTENAIKSREDWYFISEVVKSITKNAVKISNGSSLYSASPYNTLLYYIYSISPFCRLDSLKIPPPKDAEDIVIKDEYWKTITAQWNYKNKDYYFRLRKLQKEMNKSIFFEGFTLKTVEINKNLIITTQVSSTTEQPVSDFRKYSDFSQGEFFFSRMDSCKEELCNKEKKREIYYITNIEIKKKIDSALIASVEIRESITDYFNINSSRESQFKGDSIQMKRYLDINKIKYQTYFPPGTKKWSFDHYPDNPFNRTFVNQKYEKIQVKRFKKLDGIYRFDFD